MLNWLKLHDRFDFTEGLETSKELEIGQRDCDFGLVVWVIELVWIFFVKLLC